jgi:transcriptional regulator with XRE-family HTH domain
VVAWGLPSRDGPPPFGALLQRHRLAAGLSQAELAERAGLSARGISDLERGLRQAPYPATIRRLAEALGLPEAERGALLAASRRGGPTPTVKSRAEPHEPSSRRQRHKEPAPCRGTALASSGARRSWLNSTGG